MNSTNASKSRSWKNFVLWLRAELSYLLWWSKQCLRNRRLYRFPCLNGSANGVTIPSPSDKSPEQKERRDSVPCVARLSGLTLLVVGLWIGVQQRVVGETTWLVWEYPPHLLSTGLTFHVVYAGAVNVPLTNWIPFISIVGTNAPVKISGQSTNHFFGVIASNVHGSFFCDAPCLNPAAVEPVQGVRIIKGQ